MICYNERRAEASIEPPVDDSVDNGPAETVTGLLKAEVVRCHGPWQSLEAFEFAVLDRVAWFNTQRPLEPIGEVLPGEAEERCCA